MDLAPDSVADEEAQQVPKVKHRFTFRVITGASMGGHAMIVGAHHPDMFDAIGSLGGYIDYRYLGHFIRDHMLGGFCPMEQILANLDKVNDPVNGPWCGPYPTTDWEFPWSFNQFIYNDSGGHWKRNFYFNAIESISFAFGNSLIYNPDNPLLPPGVTVDWVKNAPDKCKNPIHVGKPHNFNAEYNPDGIYDLITFCDGDPVVGCKDNDPTKCGENNPDYRQLASWHDPNQEYDRLLLTLLAVDYNGNGKRDYCEPVVINASERFKDVGSDGCDDSKEDGKGGCTGSSGGTDPNHDNFDLLKNPTGTEGNNEYDEGEPFEDYGLDGVPASRSGVKDYGEGDGKFTYNPNYERMIMSDARTYMMQAPVEELRGHWWWFDGGIRDPIHALTVVSHTANALLARGADVHFYDDFVGQPTSLAPDRKCEDLLMDLDSLDWSPSKVGSSVLVRYGNPNATPQEVLMGDGGHIGTGCQVVMRVLSFFTMAMHRLPDPIIRPSNSAGELVYSSYYSEALGQRRWYAVNLPPDYSDPAYANDRYPLAVLLPGIGMPLPDTLVLTTPFTVLMAQGRLPHFVLLVPDGQCCYVRKADGKRFCNCLEKDGKLLCVQADCQGPHEACEVTEEKGKDFEQECHSGHFFVNHTTDRFGDPEAGKLARHEDALLDLLKFMDKTYRLRAPAEVEVDAALFP